MTKGWYGNRYGHSLASRGIRVSKEKFGNIGTFKDFMIEEMKNNIDISLIDIKNHLEWIFEDRNNNKLFLTMYASTTGDINLQQIYAIPTGKGLGTGVINILKKYADKYGKSLYANEVENDIWCKKTGFEEIFIEDDFEPFYEGEVRDFTYWTYKGDDF